MKHYSFSQQDFGAPPPPPPTQPGMSAPPPPPSGGIQSDKASTRAIWALILGIAAWVLGCGMFTGIPAWIMGKKEINDIDAGLAPMAGRSLASIGMWLGLINTILGIIAIIIVIILFAMGMLGSILNS